MVFQSRNEVPQNAPLFFCRPILGNSIPVFPGDFPQKQISVVAGLPLSINVSVSVVAGLDLALQQSINPAKVSEGSDDDV